VLSAAATRPKKIATGCGGFNFLLDTHRDLVFYVEDRTGNDGTERPFGKFVEYNLATGRSRNFDVPMTMLLHGPRLLTFQPLPDGATRIAYSMEGDCDLNTSDYAQPSAPAGELGYTPNQHSICFVTIPPANPAVNAAIPLAPPR